MAKSIEEVLNREIKSVKDLRNAIKEYQDSLIGVDAESEEFQQTTEMLRAAQDELTKVTRAGKDAMDASSDSIVGMQQQYKALYDQYKLLSEEQRNSDFGKNMAESLNELSNKLNETKQGVGNFKDNIGRYTTSIMDAFQQMGGSVGGLVGPFASATKGAQTFNNTLKANPIGAIIALVMGFINAIKQLVGGIKDNEESQMRLNQAMASFQPIIDGVKNAMDKVGQAIVSVIEFIAKVVDKIRLAKAAFTDFIGLTKGAKDAVKEQQAVYQDIAKSTNELTKAKREAQKANAADKAEVERLREEASETTNLAEKKKLLEEAKAKQEEIDNRNIAIAKEELRILQEQSTLTANDAAMNDKLAAAVAKVSEAEATAASNMRQFNKQLSGTEKSTGGAGSSMKNLREEAKKLYEATIENSKSEIQKLTEKYEKEKKLLEKYHYDTKELTKQYNKEMEKLQVEAAKAAAEKQSKAYVDAAKKRISQGGEFDAISESLQSQLDDALINVRQMENKKKEYDDFIERFFKIDFSKEGAIDSAKQIVDEINEILGTEIEFPKDISPENMAKFRNSLQDATKLFDEAIARMKASATKVSFEGEMEKEMTTFLQKRIDLVKAFKPEDEQSFTEEMEKITRAEIETEIKYYEQIINIANLSDQERLEALQNYYSAVDELRQFDLAEEQKAINERIGYYEAFKATASDISETLTSSSNGLIQMANGYKTLYKAQIDEGKLNEKEVKARKKRMEDLEKVVLAATVAQIVASTAQGMVDTWVGYIKETSIVNPQSAGGNAVTLGILNAASLAAAIGKSVGLAATAAGQIAAAKGGYINNVNNLRGESSAGAAVASVSTPTEVEGQPFSYTRQVQTTEEEDRLNQPIFVSVTDINNVQNRVKVTEEESSF